MGYAPCPPFLMPLAASAAPTRTTPSLRWLAAAPALLDCPPECGGVSAFVSPSTGRRAASLPSHRGMGASYHPQRARIMLNGDKAWVDRAEGVAQDVLARYADDVDR